MTKIAIYTLLFVFKKGPISYHLGIHKKSVQNTLENQKSRGILT